MSDETFYSSISIVGIEPKCVVVYDLSEPDTDLGIRSGHRAQGQTAEGMQEIIGNTHLNMFIRLCRAV